MYFLYSFKLHRIGLLSSHKIPLYVGGIQRKSDAIDVIDIFTSNLIKNKHNKWKRYEFSQDTSIKKPTWQKQKHKDSNTISILTLNQIDNLITKLKHERNFKELSTILNQCAASKKLIGSYSIALITDDITSEHDEPHLNALLKYFTILEKQLVLEPEYYYIIIEFYWQQGYFRKCLDLMTEFYHKNNGFCRVCFNFMRETIIESIDDKSEAILINVIQFCETIAVNYNDNSLLALIWLKCLRSHQCIDHNFALKLFESHSKLQSTVLTNIQTVCSSLLYDHNIEAIYRLIEILLKHDLKSKCDLVLISLFEYHCKDKLEYIKN